MGKKSVSILFIIPLAMLLSAAAIGTSNYSALIAITAIIFFTVLTRFSYALILIGLSSYFLSYLIWVFNLPGPLINLGYVLVVMVLVREYFFTANLLPVRTPINIVLFALVALAILSIAAGSSGAYASFKGLLRHIGFPLLFLMILMAEPDEKLMKRLVSAIIAMAFVQVIGSILQFTFYSTISAKPGGMRADYSGGLLGFSCGGYNAVFMGMTACLVLGISIVQGFRWYLGLAMILLLMPIYLASARAGVFLFGAGVLFMLLVAPLPKHGSFFNRLMIAGGFIVAVIVASTAGLGGSSFKQIFDPDYAYEYSMKKADSGMGRLQAFDIVTAELKTPFDKLLGKGPGTLTPTSIADNPNSLIAKNPNLYKDVTGYAYTTLELGFAGLVLFLLLYFRVYRFTRSFLRQIDDPFWESIALGFCGVIIIYVISTVYIDSWVYYPLPFTFWALAAAIYRIGVLRGILRV